MLAALSLLTLMRVGVDPTELQTRSNAALQYWQAVATIPESDSLSSREKLILQQWNTVPIDDGVRDLLERCHEAIAFFLQGATMRNCDWGLRLSLVQFGAGAPMPHLRKMRTLSNLVLLYARNLFNKGKCNEALEVVVAAIQFARHVGSTESSVGSSYEQVVETHAIRLTCHELGRCRDRELLRKFRKGLGKIPPSRSLGDFIVDDKRVSLLNFQAKGLRSVEQLIPDLANVSPAKAKSMRAFLGLQRENTQAFVDAIARSFDEAAKIAKMSPERCGDAERVLRSQLAKEADSAEVPGANIVTRLLLPPVSKMRVAEASTVEIRAMFDAALGVMIDGKESLTKTKDPIYGRPFSYRTIEGGFELESHLKGSDGRLVGLRVSSVGGSTR